MVFFKLRWMRPQSDSGRKKLKFLRHITWKQCFGNFDTQCTYRGFVGKSETGNNHSSDIGLNVGRTLIIRRQKLLRVAKNRIWGEHRSPISWKVTTHKDVCNIYVSITVICTVILIFLSKEEGKEFQTKSREKERDIV